MLSSRRLCQSAVLAALVACGVLSDLDAAGLADDPAPHPRIQPLGGGIRPRKRRPESPADPAAATAAGLRALRAVALRGRRSDAGHRPRAGRASVAAQNESRTDDILSRLETVSQLLEERRFGESIQTQELLIAEMEALLRLLQSEDERQRLQAEIERIEDLLEDTNAIIGEQKDVSRHRARRRSRGTGRRPAQRQRPCGRPREQDRSAGSGARRRQRTVGRSAQRRFADGRLAQGGFPEEGEPMEG